MISRTDHFLPVFNFHHLLELTDDTGLFQHAVYSVPNWSEGYCVDDNARALLLTALLEDQGVLTPTLESAQGTYLAFVLNSFNQGAGRFRNFLSYQRQWLEDTGSDDCHGRAVWALGTFIRRCQNLNRREVAFRLFKEALPAFGEIGSPRSLAYGILGASEYLKAYPDDQTVRRFIRATGMRLQSQYLANQDKAWRWFEEVLSYDNARLSQAMILAGRRLENQAFIECGIESLHWLRGIQTDESGIFAPVGSRNPYMRGGIKEKFDQQPIEAGGSVSAYLSAWNATGDSEWLLEAGRAFCWFIGGNHLELSLYDDSNGGCFDGLHPTRLNCNQGAESTLAFLCSLIELQRELFSSSPYLTHQLTHEVKRLRSTA